jgi:hypothetical protein
MVYHSGSEMLDKLIPMDFSGTVQCDGYGAYEHFAKHRAAEGRPVLSAGCWAHYPERDFIRSTVHEVSVRMRHRSAAALNINPDAFGTS